MMRDRRHSFLLTIGFGIIETDRQGQLLVSFQYGGTLHYRRNVGVSSCKSIRADLRSGSGSIGLDYSVPVLTF